MARSKNYTQDTAHWYAADFETLTPNTEFFARNLDTRVILFNVQTIFNDNVDYTGNTIEEFLEFCFRDNVSKTIFFHNLSFDGTFVVPALIKMGFNPDIAYRKKNRRLEIFQQGAKIYYIRAFLDTTKMINGRRKRVKMSVIFRDSLVLMPTSIKALGKAVKIEKFQGTEDQEANFYDWEPEDLDLNREDGLSERAKAFVNYCKRDVAILRESLKAYFNMLTSLDDVRLYNLVNADNPWKPHHYLTIGATAIGLINNIYMQRFRAKTGFDEFRHEISFETYQRVAPTYRGGITQFNPVFQGEPRELAFGGFGLDITSSYPFQMTDWLPFGDVLDEIDPSIPHQTFLNVRIRNLKIRPEFRSLVVWPNKQNAERGRFLEEAEEWQGSFVKEEFDLLAEIYTFEVVAMEEFFMKTAPFLKEGIEQLYSLKDKFTRENNPAFRLISKLLLNSIYGKFAQKTAFNSYIFSVEEKERGENVELDKRFDKTEGVMKSINGIVQLESRSFGWGHYRCFVVSPLEHKEHFSNKATGSVITAKARVKLIKMMKDVIEWGRDNNIRERFGIEPADLWLYSDTDSVFVQAVPGLLEWIKEQGWINEELGGWTMEKEFKYFGVHAAKRYACLDVDGNPVKTGLAGVKLSYEQAKMLDMNWDEETTMLASASLAPERLPSGTIIRSINKVLRKGNL